MPINQVNLLVERWKKKALKPVRGTDRFQELKDQINGPIFSQAPFPWFNSLLPSYIQHYIHENEDLLALSPQMIRTQHPTRTAIISEFRKKIPFVKHGEPSNHVDPLIRHNHFYSSEILKDLLLHLKYDDTQKKKTTTTTTNQNQPIYVRLEAKSIQFSEGYQKAWKYIIEINDIWNVLFFHMKCTENSMYDALMNIHHSSMNTTTTSTTSSSSQHHTNQIQLALHLLHIYRAQCLESDLISSDIELNIQRNHLANFLQTHFHTLFNVLVDDHSVWNQDAQRAASNRNFFLTQIGLATSWIMPRFLYFMYKTQVIPHEPPVLSNTIQAYHAGSLTMIHLWHLHAATAYDDPIHNRIVSAFYAGFLVVDAGRNWTNMLLFRNHPHYQIPDPFLHMASNFTTLQIFSPVLLYIFVHFLAILWLRIPARVALGADVLIMMTIAYTTWIEFEFIENFHQRRHSTRLYDPSTPIESSRFEYVTSIFFPRDYVRNTFGTVIDTRPSHPGMHQLRLSNVNDTSLELWSLFQYGCLVQVANTSTTTMINVAGGGRRTSDICLENDDLEFRNFLDGVNLDLKERRQRSILQQQNETQTLGKNTMNHLLLHLNASNPDTIVLFNMLKPLSSYFLRMFSSIPNIIHDVTNPPSPFNEKCIIVASEEAVEVIRQYAPQIFAQQLYNVQQGIQKENAPLIDSWKQNVPREVINLLLNGKTYGCMTLSMPSEAWVTQPQQIKYTVDLNGIEIISNLNHKDRQILKADFMAYKIRTFSKQKQLPYKFQLKPYVEHNDKETKSVGSSTKRITLIECIRHFLLPAILLDIQPLSNMEYNPYNTLQDWIQNAKNNNIGIPTKNDITIFKHAIALSYLSLQNEPKLQQLMGVIHHLTIKQFWPIACSPIWFYRTRAVANVDWDVFDWTETFLDETEGKLTNNPFNLVKYKSILNAYFNRKDSGIIEEGSELEANQSISESNNNAKRAFLLLNPQQGQIIARVNAMHLLCMGRLPRPIPWDLSEEKDITIVCDFIKRYPRVYTLQLMKLFTSQLILQHGYLLLPSSVSFFSTVSTPNYEEFVTPAVQKIRKWILYARDEFQISWDEMTEHLFFLFNFWHLYSNIPYGHHTYLNPIHLVDNEVMHKVSSAWSETDPSNFHGLEHFYQSLMGKNPDNYDHQYIEKHSRYLGDMNHKIADEFWHLLKFSKRIYKKTEF